MTGEGEDSPFRYHLELNPQQLKVIHTALRALLDDFGHDEAQVHALVREVLAKLPDEHAIRAIRLDQEPRAPEEILAAPPQEAPPPPATRPDGPTSVEDPEGDDEPPPTVA